jgi:hypothetical protein
MVRLDEPGIGGANTVNKVNLDDIVAGGLAAPTY